MISCSGHWPSSSFPPLSPSHAPLAFHPSGIRFCSLARRRRANPPLCRKPLPDSLSQPLPAPSSTRYPTMADLQGRKVFKVFNQDFIVDDRYTVTKELGQGAYGIVW